MCLITFTISSRWILTPCILYYTAAVTVPLQAVAALLFSVAQYLVVYWNTLGVSWAWVRNAQLSLYYQASTIHFESVRTLKAEQPNHPQIIWLLIQPSAFWDFRILLGDVVRPSFSILWLFLLGRLGCRGLLQVHYGSCLGRMLLCRHCRYCGTRQKPQCSRAAAQPTRDWLS